MFHRPLAILLVFSFIAANFQCLFVVAGFELNQKYIAEKLCENRDKPWMHCNGKCVLAKKMKQAEEKEDKTDRQAKFQRLQEVAHTSEIIRIHPEILLAVFDHQPLLLLPEEQQSLFFHPPKV